MTKESKKKDRGRFLTAYIKFAQKARANFENKILPSMLPQVQKRCLNQSPRAVRSTFASRRIDHYVRSNKAMGVGFQREGGRLLPAENLGIFCVSRIFGCDTGDDSTYITCHLATISHSLWLPLWLLSGNAESNIKKKLNSEKHLFFANSKNLQSHLQTPI